MDLAFTRPPLWRLGALVAPIAIALACALAAPAASADVSGGPGLVTDVAAQEAPDAVAASDDFAITEPVESAEPAAPAPVQPEPAVETPPAETPADPAPEPVVDPVVPAQPQVAHDVVEPAPAAAPDPEPQATAPGSPSPPPANVNVVIRILSPGDDGDVGQDGGVLIGGAPVTLPEIGGDWTWNWNWTWDTGCAPSDLPTPMTTGADGWSWDWTWDWSCGEAPAPQSVPAPVATPHQPSNAAPLGVAPFQRVAGTPVAAPPGTDSASRSAERPTPSRPGDGRDPAADQTLAAPVPARVRTAVLAPALSTVADARGKAHASAGALPGPDPAGEPPAPDPPSPAPPAATAGAAGGVGGGSLLLAALLGALTLLAPGRGRRMRGHAPAPRSPLDSRRPERPG